MEVKQIVDETKEEPKKEEQVVAWTIGTEDDFG
jgi:hypothetical protein